MIWEVLKDGNRSCLVGAAHFFPYSFKRSLTRYIEKVDTVLLEGPLDESNMSRVIEHGAKGDINPSSRMPLMKGQ